MLGVRLCSELKTVPTSLVFWLIGLVAWAGSAALGQEMLKIDISVQFRIWLRSALWLGGLTSIWLASLSYLRVVYIEAQRRFLLRGRLAASVSSTWKERLTESMPTMPKMPSFRLRRPTDDDVEVAKPSPKRGEKVNATEKQPRRFGLPSFMKRKEVSSSEDPSAKSSAKDLSQELRTEQRAEPQRAQKTEQRTEQRSEPRIEQRTGVQTGGPLSQARRSEPTSGGPSAPTSSKQPSIEGNKEQTDRSGTAKRSWLSRLVSKPNTDDSAPEYRKVDKTTRAAEQLAAKNEKLRLKEEQRQAKKTAAAKGALEGEGDARKRSWIPKLSMPKMKMPSLPRPKLPKFGIPKLKLPSLRLPPPESTAPTENRVTAKPDIRPLPTTKSLPTTNGPAQESLENNGRPLSKAERKRLKRIHGDQDYDVEDRRAA